MAISFIFTNLAITIIVGMGIYSFSGSIVWAIIGAMVITGSASANPIFALLAYPAVEYFFNDGDLTIYSAIVVGITIAQMSLVVCQTVLPERLNSVIGVIFALVFLGVGFYLALPFLAW